MFGDKVKTSTLWSMVITRTSKVLLLTHLAYKHALYWWAAVLVDGFTTFWHQWHVETCRHIQYVAQKESLSTGSWKKNNLSHTELALIFRHIMDQDYGVANLKQHWAAMLMAWTTAARPGSFTVAKDYQKGASLGMSYKIAHLLILI